MGAVVVLLGIADVDRRLFVVEGGGGYCEMLIDLPVFIIIIINDSL